MEWSGWRSEESSEKAQSTVLTVASPFNVEVVEVRW